MKESGDLPWHSRARPKSSKVQMMRQVAFKIIEGGIRLHLGQKVSFQLQAPIERAQASSIGPSTSACFAAQFRLHSSSPPRYSEGDGERGIAMARMSLRAPCSTGILVAGCSRAAKSSHPAPASAARPPAGEGCGIWDLTLQGLESSRLPRKPGCRSAPKHWPSMLRSTSTGDLECLDWAGRSTGSDRSFRTKRHLHPTKTAKKRTWARPSLTKNTQPQRKNLRLETSGTELPAADAEHLGAPDQAGCLVEAEAPQTREAADEGLEKWRGGHSHIPLGPRFT